MMDNLGLSHCYALTMDHEHLNIDYRHARGGAEGASVPLNQAKQYFRAIAKFQAETAAEKK